MIRTASREDMPKLLEVGWKYYKFAPFEEHGLNYKPQDLERYIINMIGDPDNSGVLIAEKMGCFAGTTGIVTVPWFMDHGQKQIFEMWWWVEEEYRGSGVAKEMMAAIERWAVFHGAACLKMASLPNEHQDRLDKFYMKRGFSPADHFFGKRL